LTTLLWVSFTALILLTEGKVIWTTIHVPLIHKISPKTNGGKRERLNWKTDVTMVVMTSCPKTLNWTKWSLCVVKKSLTRYVQLYMDTAENVTWRKISWRRWRANIWTSGRSSISGCLLLLCWCKRTCTNWCIHTRLWHITYKQYTPLIMIPICKMTYCPNWDVTHSSWTAELIPTT